MKQVISDLSLPAGIWDTDSVLPKSDRLIDSREVLTLGEWLDVHYRTPYVRLRGVPGQTIIRPRVALDARCPTVTGIAFEHGLHLLNPHECYLDISARASVPDPALLIECTVAGLPEVDPGEVWPFPPAFPTGAKLSRSYIRLRCRYPKNQGGVGLRIVNEVTDEIKDAHRLRVGFDTVNSFTNQSVIEGHIKTSGQAIELIGAKRVFLRDMHVDAAPGLGLHVGRDCAHIDWLRGPGWCERIDKNSTAPTITGAVDQVQFIGWDQREIDLALGVS